MAPKRSSRKPRTQARYVVSATFRMKTTPLSKAQSDKWVKKFRSKNGVVTVKKV